MTTSFRQRRVAASIAIALSTLYIQSTTVSSFEVPFPQTSAEIRDSAVLTQDLLATTVSTPPSPKSPSLPLPVTRSVQLDSGTRAEVISCSPKKSPSNFLSFLLGSGKEKAVKPVLVFLHGSFHASWCWAEYYMPYFAGFGYECVAFSLQGTGGTLGEFLISLLHLACMFFALTRCTFHTSAIPEGIKKVKIANHVADLDSFLRALSNKTNNNLGLDLGDIPRVVLIGHSFGGLTIMKWLEKNYSSNYADKNEINLAGVGLMCSVPPSGNGPMTLRYLLRSLSDSWKITVGFAMKKAIVDKQLCRELFFGGDVADSGVSDEDLERYQSYFERDTVTTIDLSDLAGTLPSLRVDKESRNAPFVNELKKLPLKPFVVGAKDDFIVDTEGVEETAKYLGLDVDEVKIVDSPHDVMLGRKWQNGADAILDWIRDSTVN